MLQCVAVWFNAPYVCSVLQCVAVCCSMIWCDIMWCSVMQCAAVRCSVLQCVAVHCSVLQWLVRRLAQLPSLFHRKVCCSVLQCVAVCCSVLQCVAMTPYIGLKSVLQCVAALQCVAVCCNDTAIAVFILSQADLFFSTTMFIFLRQWYCHLYFIANRNELYGVATVNRID